jgi:hypothetical protein
MCIWQYCLLSFLHCKYCSLPLMYCKYDLLLFALIWSCLYIKITILFMFAFNEIEWDISLITFYYHFVLTISFIFYTTGTFWQNGMKLKSKMLFVKSFPIQTNRIGIAHKSISWLFIPPSKKLLAIRKTTYYTM